MSHNVAPSAEHPRCKACQHPALDVLDAALVGGAAARAVAAAHGLPARSVQRHAERHLPAALAKAQDAVDVAHGDRLLAELEDLQRRTMSILERAERGREDLIALRAISEARRNLELVARVMGEIQDGATVNIHLSTEWLQIRAVVLGALRNHPDARSAVVDALGTVNGPSS